MIDVALCITREHNLPLVGLALLVSLIGSAATMQLFGRIRVTSGSNRFYWIMLCAVATGTMVWCTHFIAMMAFEAQAPVTLDAELTLVSLAIAIVLAAPGLALAAHSQRRLAGPGGAMIGMAVAAMHYTGMAAYRIEGIVTWSAPLVTASVLLSCGIGAASFAIMRSTVRFRRAAGALLLGLAVAALHFTGMAAMHIAVLNVEGAGLSSGAQHALATATACAGILFVGCAAVSALIDGHTQSETFQRLRRMALHDGLTDLPNRLSFHEDLNARLQRAGGTSRMAVVMLDLSRFKSVNDTYGHQAGDQLLIALAARLRALVGEDECVARLGGDEFAALVSYDRPAELDDFIARLRSTFDEPFAFERFNASIAANIGVARAPDDGNQADTLLARADLAMYRAKSAHSAIPCFYDPGMDDSVRDRRELANDLRAAVASGDFQLHYQVQAAIETGAITGYEVLVRWHHPSRGAIPPSYFIPLAEEIGEIIPLSNWILRQACFEAALQPRRGAIAVNLSPLHLSDPGLIETVRLALVDSKLDPSRLALELTESAIIHDRRYALEQLNGLKAMGLRLALDDFGVGYSSLDVLRAFAFDRIKLDASFVAEIEQDEQAVAILRSVAALGASLGIPVLAEGVETPAQLRIVAREGCSAIQGYLIGRPSRDLVEPETVFAAMSGLPRIDRAQDRVA